jgi:hypothetical protein
MKRTVSFMSMFLLTFILFTLVHSDVYMKQKRHTDGMKIMGQEQPAKDEIDEIWLTAKGIRTDNPQNSIIILLAEKKMIMIDHVKKTYTEIPMNMEQIITEAAKQEGKDAEEVEQGAEAGEGMVKMEIKVQPTSETKKINNWNCKKYNLTMNTFMGLMNTEVWASEDLKVDKDLYAKYFTSLFSMMPGMQGGMGEMMKEIEKIKGVQVLSSGKQSIMGQTISSSTELLEFKNGTAPANLLKIPAGYKQTKFMQPD